MFDDYLSSVWLPCWCVKCEKKKRRPDSSYHLPAERLLRSGRSVFFDEERAVYNCKLHRSCSHDDIFFMTEGFCTQISLMNNRVKQFSRFLYCRISPSPLFVQEHVNTVHERGSETVELLYQSAFQDKQTVMIYHLD